MPAAGPSLRDELAAMPRQVWVLAAGSFINRFGSFVVPFLVLYLSHQGYRPAQAALAVSAYAVGKIVAGPAGGTLTDRFGAKSVTITSMFTSGAATLALGLARGLGTIIALACLTGLTSELYRPSTSAIMAHSVPAAQRATAFSVYQLGVSVGTAAGPAVGGLVAEHSFTALFIADAGTSLIWGAVAWLALSATPASSRGPAPATRPARVTVLADARLLQLTVATFLVNTILFQAQTTLPLWIRHQGHSSATYGLLLGLNSALIMLLQLPSTRVSNRFTARTVVAISSLAVGAGFVMLIPASTIPAMAGAVAVWSLGELAQWPVGAAYTTSLAPAGLTGRYAGTRSLAYGLALLVAPLAGTFLYDLNPVLLWTACGATAAAAAVIMTIKTPRPAAVQQTSCRWCSRGQHRETLPALGGWHLTPAVKPGTRGSP